MRGHARRAILFRIRLLALVLQKQKLNTQSSTEGEIIGTSNALLKVLFINLFIVAQGYLLKENATH